MEAIYLSGTKSGLRRRSSELDPDDEPLAVELSVTLFMRTFCRRAWQYKSKHPTTSYTWVVGCLHLFAKVARIWPGNKTWFDGCLRFVGCLHAVNQYVTKQPSEDFPKVVLQVIDNQRSRRREEQPETVLPGLSSAAAGVPRFAGRPTGSRN